MRWPRSIQLAQTISSARGLVSGLRCAAQERWCSAALAVVLSATGGRRINAGRSCSDYETEITIDVFYVDTQGRSLSKAIADSEAIIEALYTWSVTNSIGVSRIEPDLAVASLLDDSDLVMSRTMRVVFEYGA